MSSSRDVNVGAVEALKRLATALAELDDTGADGSKISHWREIPNDVESAYKMLIDGSELVKATSTKYTLVGKINFEDVNKLAEELRKGCELVGTGAVVLCSQSMGCSRSTRHFAKRSARAVVATVISLIESFLDESAMEGNVGAQKTGAVWSACDGVIKVPKGNRSAMRRDLLTWAMECNETMKEFEEIVELGPSSDERAEEKCSGGENSVKTWDDFCEAAGTGDQYTASEIRVAQSCLALIKCSRGTVGAALKACECAGEEVVRCGGDETRQKAILKWIGNLHDAARRVGEGVTELGILLYPPLDVGSRETKLGMQIAKQRDAIVAVHDYIIEAVPEADENSEGSQIIIPMSEEVSELASKLRVAGRARFEEAQTALTGAARAEG